MCRHTAKNSGTRQRIAAHGKESVRADWSEDLTRITHLSHWMVAGTIQRLAASPRKHTIRGMPYFFFPFLFSSSYLFPFLLIHTFDGFLWIDPEPAAAPAGSLPHTAPPSTTPAPQPVYASLHLATSLRLLLLRGPAQEQPTPAVMVELEDLDAGYLDDAPPGAGGGAAVASLAGMPGRLICARRQPVPCQDLGRSSRRRLSWWS